MPETLIDPEGEGVYVLADAGSSTYSSPALVRAAAMLGVTSFRALNVEWVWMVPVDGSDEWRPAMRRRFPRIPYPRRARVFAYCTPAEERGPADSQGEGR